MAIGARSQSARTYLEKNLDNFVDSNQDELIKHCMRALRDTLPNEVELTVKVSSFIRSDTFQIDNFIFRTVLLLLLAKIHHLLY
jgi:20S proteasome alpha/beta subunit